MSESIWRKIDEVFPQVADLPAAERDARLRELCDGDETLRREILALLRADEKNEDFIESPVSMPDSLAQIFRASLETGNLETTASKGRRFGAYRVIGKLGAGGMGAVYLAERADGEFHKKAAVKLVKNSADTAFNQRRFRHERQVLAALEHPNIARLLDGGTTDDGAPYLVMEYVEGKPLHNYCAAHALDTIEKLRLFRQVLAAVAYAHEQGVIHRDIKPGNILVSDGGVVKLLDFGIAKILDTDLIHDSLGQTDTLFRQLTPEYASPEQICGDDVTPASDIYSLGVVLYELLCGERPYKFASRAPHEIARVICEQPVAAPRVNGEKAVAEDLQYIVLKSLQKKPRDRYAAIADFDEDLRKFLDEAPVRREKFSFESGIYAVSGAASPGAAIVSLAVAPFEVLSGDEKTDAASRSEEFLGIGLADALTTRLSNMRQIAVRPTSSVMRLAETHDAGALGRALGADFVLTGRILRGEGGRIRVGVQLLKVSDDSVLWAQSFDESETDIFRLQDSISDRVAASLVPQLTIEEQDTLHHHGTKNAEAYKLYLRGRVYFHNYTFGGISAAENCLRQAIDCDPDFALAHSALADFYNLQTVFGLTSNAEGFARAKRAALRAVALDPHLAEAYTALAFTTWAYDWNFAAAERLFRKSLELNPNYPRAHEWYAFLLSVGERHEEAISEMRLAERLDPHSPALVTMSALVYYNARQYEQSLEKTRRALELDPDYYIALQSLGWICPRLGKFDEGVAACRRAVRINDEQPLNKFSLALALIDAGQTKEARAIAAELETRRKSSPVPAYYPALIYAMLGEDDKTFAWLDEAIKERGYYTLRMRVEPRFDRWRTDARFIRRLAQLRPLNEPDASDTKDDSTARATGEVQATAAAGRAVGKLKTRTALAVAGLIGLAAVAATLSYSNRENRETPPAATLAAASPVENPPPIEKPRSKDAVADGLYLAAKQQMAARTADGLAKAIGLFKQAVERDASFALAYSGLADAHMLNAKNEKNPADAYQKSEENAVKALALDPDLAEARISLAMARYRRANAVEEAERHFLRAIEIDPRQPTARHWYSVVLYETGRYEDALREIEIAAALDPRSAVIQSQLAICYKRLNRFDEAFAHANRAIELESRLGTAYVTKSIILQFRGEYEAAMENYRQSQIVFGGDENDPFWLIMQAHAHAAAGRRTEGATALNRLYKTPQYAKNPAGFALDAAIFYHLLGENERVFEWLRKVEVKKKIEAESLTSDPRLAKLHADPRFTELAEKWRNAAAAN